MNFFGEILAVDNERARQFFYQYLSEEVGPRNKELEIELHYVATVLASYCSTSVGGESSEVGAPLLGELTEIFDNYIFSSDGHSDAQLMEAAGAQTLLYIGFFQTQQEDRHKVGWFIQIGRSFYKRAAFYSKNEKRKSFFNKFSTRFIYWAEICRKLNQTFRGFADEALVIKLPPEIKKRP